MREDKGRPITLRPHHLLCLRTWAGRGYSEAFTGNMDRIARLLRENPDRRVLLVRGADEICAACPNLTEDGTCRSEEKVRRLDDGVTGLLEAEGTGRHSKGCSSSAGTAFGNYQLVIDSRLNEFTQEKLCGECEWFTLCKVCADKRKDGTDHV